MTGPDLIEQRQYAETVLGGLNIRPFRVDVTQGVLFVPKARVCVVQKLCQHFDWPFVVTALTGG
tara:strand:- start:281 stop:472 length:192 start_codon:yes stop_codon:yes gene_type:complete